MTHRVTRGQLAADVALAAVFTALGLVQLFVPNDDGYYDGPLALNIFLTLVMTFSLAARRVWPFEVAFGALLIQVLPTPFVATGSSFYGMAVPAAILVFGAARWGSRPQAVAVGALPLVLFPAQAIHVPAFREWQELVFPILMLGSSWAAGRVINRLDWQRHELDAALNRVAEQQEELNRQAVLAERARIAREMHDVVAHGVSVMLVQAGSARVELPEGGVASRRSLLAVEQAGREVLGELRRVVSLLRGEDDPAVDPAPGLADLPMLVDSMRSVGLEVILEVAPEATADAGRELAVYRIVQEALTNALRHAGPTQVEVRVGVDGGELTVDVVDGGPPTGHRPPERVGSGSGLIGLRERIAMYGGRLDSGRRGDGYAVHAGIPVEIR